METPAQQCDESPPDVAEVQSTDVSTFMALVTDMLVMGTPVRFTASGCSMRPSIHAGDRLTVVPLRAGTFRRGSVVLYRRLGGLTAHRVLAVSGRGSSACIRVRGDASRGRIDQIPCADVLGVVTRVERGARVLQMDSAWRRAAGLTRAWCGTWRVSLGRLLHHTAFR